MNLQDSQPSFLVWNAYLYFTVKSSWPSQCRIQNIWNVCSCDNNNLSPSFQAVHQCKELCNNPSFNFSTYFFPFWGYSINFVNKNYAGCIFFCFFKFFAEVFFALSVILAHYFRSVNQEEIGICFICNCFCKQCFSCPRRAVKKNSFWRLNAERLKNLRVLQWKLNHLPDFLDFLLQSANVLVSYANYFFLFQLNCFWIEDNF